MIKKLTIAILLVFTVLFTFTFQPVQAATADTLVIHYKRFDENYEDWFLWLWHDGIDQDAAHYFNGTDSYGVTATIDIDLEYGDIPNIGILIRDGDWNKDFQSDRFIDLTNPNENGEVHAYFLQGEGFFSYVSEDQPGCNPEIKDPNLCAQVMPMGLLDVYFDAALDIHFFSTDIVSASDITIYKDDQSETFSGFTSGKNGILSLVNPVDLSSTYRIEINYNGTLSSRVVRLDVDYDSSLFAEYYHYDGDLGIEYSQEETTFKLWAPVSSEVELNLYTAGHTTFKRADGADTPYAVYDLEYLEKGVWTVTVPGDLHGVYYTYNVVNSGNKVTDVPDPYSISTGINGMRSMVVDLALTDPVGWEQDQGVNGYQNANDAIIYELHVRDLTSHASWGGPEDLEGTYLGFTIEGTTYTNPINNETVTTGLDHLAELGVTHIHLLPTYDQDGWNDEENFSFNWGYNPQHYNVPEGGYSTDPFNGAVRITEYKEMVMALHNKGINVINDVVYNHTASGDYSFSRIVPNYFHRIDDNGIWSNGSGVGNETASERYMVRKYIVESVEYWAEEYHIDGFRFDLMSIHDYQTMNELAIRAEAVDPDIFIYGEPWGGGTIALDWNLQAGKNNLWRMPLIGAFNDNLRNAIKGSPDGSDSGYISNSQNVYTILDGLEGSFDYGDWSHSNTTQVINYVSAHDNLTLFDKLKSVHGASGYTKQIDYEARLSNSIVMFSQGVPFLHAGVDFLRTKGGDHNSYDAPDSVNQLNYVRKSNYVNSFEYYQGIIEVRKAFESFKMQTDADIDANLTNLNPGGYGTVGIRLTKNNEDILVYFNGGAYVNDINLPSGAWELLVDRDEAGLEGMGTFATRYPIEKAETLVFVKGNNEDVIPSPQSKPEITTTIGVAFEGASFRLSSTSTIVEYSINDGEWITVDVPNTFIYIPDLQVGFYDLRIKDEFGGISDPFTVEIKVNPNAVSCEDDPDQAKCELTCEEDPNQEKCEQPLVCEEGYILQGEECVLIEEPTVPECNPGFILEDGFCVREEVVPETGCFGEIKLSLLSIAAISLLGFVIIRRFK